VSGQLGALAALEKQENYGTVHQLFMDFQENLSVRREVQYKILTQFVIPMKLDRLTEVCLN
jgi:hypothetical protein